jgi:hypothetical protein
MAAAAAVWTDRELSMQGIHRYMLRMLQEYAKLQTFAPSPRGLRAVDRQLVGWGLHSSTSQLNLSRF